jgi:CNT family concentrative nucleoside transporter
VSLFARSQDAINGKFSGEWFTKNKHHFISFEGECFKHNFFSKDTVIGTWEFNSEKKELRLYEDLALTRTIDSTVIQSDSTGHRLLYYSNGAHIATKIDDRLIQEVGVISFHTELKKNNQLILIGENQKFKLAQPTVVKEVPGFSVSFESILRGIMGMAFLIILAWIFSANRSAINWSLVLKGLALQFIIAILVLKVPAVTDGFNWISKGFVKVIGFTDEGVNFLFAQFGTNEVQPPLLTFAIKVLPTIIFFSALVSLFYYWGILQKIVYAFAWLMKRFMKLSGAESLAAAGNVFLGQTEAPLLVKPYLLGMTKSEIMCLMTGGMATIAGGVLAAYVNFLGGDDPVQQAFFAKHLLTASIISAPAAVIAAKILVPETEKINEKLEVSKEKIGTNALEAISNGTTDGLRLAVNVGAMLLVFTALLAFGNYLLDLVGRGSGLNEVIATGGIYTGLSFEFLLGYMGRPIVWMMGVEWADSIYVGELLGTKTVLNEFVAYPRLGEMKEAGLLSEKSIIMSTYMLCGFANFASIGIQIGGIGSLVPSRKGLLSKLGVRALIGGTIACLMTAVIVGMTL